MIYHWKLLLVEVVVVMELKALWMEVKISLMILRVMILYSNFSINFIF